MIFSISEPKSQSYRTARFEAIRIAKQVLNNVHFNKDDFNHLTNQVYNKGVFITNSINMMNNFSHKDYSHTPTIQTTTIQEVHKTIAKKAQAAEAAEAAKKAQAAEAAKKAQAAEAAKKVKAAEATKKAQALEAAEAAKKAQALEAAEAAKKAQAVEPEEAAKKAQPVEPVEAAKKAQPVESAKKTQPVEPVEAAKKAQAAEAAEAVKKAQAVEPAEAVKKQTEFEKHALKIFPSTDYPDLSHHGNNETEKKLLVLFVYHIYNERVKHFIHKCIFYHNNVDFIIIANTNNHHDKPHIVNIPNKQNVKMLFRKNIGYDFGGWSDALLLNNLYENYDNFIFVNSSVTGPFLKPDFKGKWTDIYINGLKKNVKLFGSTINTLGDSNVKTQAHVQSYIFSMDKITLKYLINCSIFSMTNYAKTFESAIQHKEILMSRKIIKNNWNIGSLLKYYENVDFTFSNKQKNKRKINFLNDIMYPEYKNKIWNEYEVVFIKGNRVRSTISI